MFIDMEEEKAFSPIKILINNIFFAGLIMVIFIGALGFYLAGSISKPIMKLTEGTETIGIREFIMKPILARQLGERIRSVLDNKIT